ncbi:hypothetical protein E2542_SST28034 [Spatholobus suberectus]|nr:hypothetical protein E2542_SST28034 [Spatholobus suberectus]
MSRWLQAAMQKWTVQMKVELGFGALRRVIGGASLDAAEVLSLDSTRCRGDGGKGLALVDLGSGFEVQGVPNWVCLLAQWIRHLGFVMEQETGLQGQGQVVRWLKGSACKAMVPSLRMTK